LLGQVRVTRRTWQTGAIAGRTFSGEDIAILRPEEIRQLQDREVLVLAENGKPIIARLIRCIDGKAGRRLATDRKQLRSRLTETSLVVPTVEDRAAAALAEARHLGIAAEQESRL
jgi:type IV secretion system protein VirD4